MVSAVCFWLLCKDYISAINKQIKEIMKQNVKERMAAIPQARAVLGSSFAFKGQ